MKYYLAPNLLILDELGFKRLTLHTVDESYEIISRRYEKGSMIITSNKSFEGKNLKPVFLPPRPGDVFRTYADISKIKKMLKFELKISFEEGLKRTIKYFKIKYSG
jgi:nucleoside-diphosphate-sugar epimerase